MDDERPLKITISPEPTADERDAVVAALSVLLVAEEELTPEPRVAPPSNWARAGRIEAMGGIDRRLDRGRSRRRPS